MFVLQQPDFSCVSMDISLRLTGHEVGVHLFQAGSVHLNDVPFFMT